MRNRVLLIAGAVALVTASCAQPEPQVLSEAPQSITPADVTSSPTETTDREDEPGRFIARCATEADGGTPGMTFFTDGSQNVTDHCLSRYYIGVQPAPGALYVPDDQAGTDAPSRETTTTTTAAPQWTLAQPRTDAGLSDTDAGRTDDDRVDDDDDLELIADGDDEASDVPVSDAPDAPPTDDPDATTPTTPPNGTTTPTAPPTPTTPGGPGAPAPSGEGQPEPTTTGSTSPGEQSTVPTGGQAPGRVPPTGQSAPGSADYPWGSLSTAGQDGSDGPQTSLVMPDILPGLQWPAPALPGSGPAS